MTANLHKNFVQSHLTRNLQFTLMFFDYKFENMNKSLQFNRKHVYTNDNFVKFWYLNTWDHLKP